VFLSRLCVFVFNCSHRLAFLLSVLPCVERKASFLALAIARGVTSSLAAVTIHNAQKIISAVVRLGNKNSRIFFLRVRPEIVLLRNSLCTPRCRLE
jgi:hypothetical protein